MNGLLGTKIGMTRIFDENGTCVPVTVVKVDSCWIVGKCTQEKNGYNSIIVGYGEKKKGIKAWTGQFKNVKEGKIARKLKEIRFLI